MKHFLDIDTSHLHRTDHALLNFLFPYSVTSCMSEARWQRALEDISDASDNPAYAESRKSLYLLAEGAVRSSNLAVREKAAEVLADILKTKFSSANTMSFMEDIIENVNDAWYSSFPSEWKSQIRYPLKVLLKDPEISPKKKVLQTLQSESLGLVSDIETGSKKISPKQVYKQIYKTSWNFTKPADIQSVSAYASKEREETAQFLQSVFRWTLKRLNSKDVDMVLTRLYTLPDSDWRRSFFGSVAVDRLPQKLVEQEATVKWNTWGEKYVPYIQSPSFLNRIAHSPLYKFKYQGIGILQASTASQDLKLRTAERLVDLVSSEWKNWTEVSQRQYVDNKIDTEEVYATEACKKFSEVNFFITNNSKEEAALKTIDYFSAIAANRSYNPSDIQTLIDMSVRTEDPDVTAEGDTK